MVSKVANLPKAAGPTDNTLAQTIVEQGPRDDQARVDGYGGHIGPLRSQFATVLPKYTDDLFGSYKSLTQALGLPSVNLENLSGLQKIKEIVKSLDPDKLIKRFEDNVLGGRSIQSIMQLPAKFKQDALGTLQDLTKDVSLGGLNIGELIKTGKMQYDEASKIYNMVKNGDWTTLKGVSKALGQLDKTLGGNALLSQLDLHAVSAFLGEMASTAAELGDSSLVKEISALFKDSKQRDAALGTAVYNAATRSDLSTLNAITEIMGGDSINNNYPKATAMLLQNFKLEPFYKSEAVNDYRERLLDVLNKIDKDWCYTEHAGQKVMKLEPFYEMSGDAKQILMSHDDLADGYSYKTAIMLANGYPKLSSMALIQSFYPNYRI